MSYEHIPAGEHFPEKFNVIVEIPKGTHNKYEYDEELHLIKLDRVLYSPLYYPTDYGFIPQTRSEDGDHLDAILLTDSPVFPGCLVEARPIGLLKMIDGGEEDFKILAVPTSNPHFTAIQKLEDVDPHTIKEIAHFFSTYKLLENKTVEVGGWSSKEEAIQALQESAAHFQKNG